MTDDRQFPPDGEPPRGSDALSDLVAEGAARAQGWAERLARALDERGTPPPAAPGAPSSRRGSTSAADRSPAETASATDAGPVMDAAPPPPDVWAEVSDDPVSTGPVQEATASTVDPGPPPPSSAVDAQTETLRRLVAERLGVPPTRVQVDVTVLDAQHVGGDRSVTPSLTPNLTLSPDAAPRDVVASGLSDLASRARARLAEELGTRVPDLVAEVRFPAGGRPSVSVRPSAPRGAAEPGPTRDLEAALRRLILGPDR